MEWATLPLKKYADFTGRARRKEYWMFALLYLGLAIAATVIDIMLGMNQMVAGLYGPVTLLLALGFLVPSIAVGARRLHDTDRSGWWLLIGLVPFVGGIILLVFFVIEGTRGSNKFGPDPKAGEVAA